MNNNTPVFTHRVKQDESAAKKYGARKLKKHLAEMNLIQRGIDHLDPAVKSMLDAPCGVGRATIWLANRGYSSTGLDLGLGAVDMARQEVKSAGVEATIVQGDLLSMDFPNNHFDGVLCFRVYHHFPDEVLRKQLIEELCRVANSYVLISYFSPYSVTSIKRQLRQTLGLKVSKQHATSLESIQREFRKQGFQLNADIPQRRFVHTLHLAVFERIQTSST